MYSSSLEYWYKKGLAKPEPQENQITATGTYEAGILVRNNVRGYLEHYCLLNHIECQLAEMRHMLSSSVTFRLKGPESKVKLIVSWLQSI